VAVRDELAGRLLENLLDWDADERRIATEQIRTLADLKYDGYEGFHAGQRFLESLAQWLRQMPDPAMRRRWLQFILQRLIYIDRRELEHTIETVYPDIIRPLLVRQTASALDVAPYLAAQVTASDQFRRLHRKLLVLGLSDGARIDRLRRASKLSHEQFSLTVEIGPKTRTGMLDKLRAALSDDTAMFSHVLLVDDFYGSGTSLVDVDENGALKGKLARARDEMNDLKGLTGGAVSILEQGATATVIVYIASARAQQHIRDQLAAAAFPWDLHVVQTIGAAHAVTDEQLREDCEWFYDHILDDPFKGEAPLGYKQTALPAVLSHNTPNNSVSPLWADTTGRADSLQRRALFPRYERHHPDRR
jgi:hypothetical protein